MRFTNEFRTFLQAAVQAEKLTVSCDAPLADLFTMRIGGRAALLLAPREIACLCRLLRLCVKEAVPYYLLGNGSNTVFGNSFFDGAVITTRDLQNIEICGTKITADCGASLNQLILAAARKGLCGMEMLYGIPGTVGGAVRMNAGAHGEDIAACLDRALLFSPSCGQARWFSRTELSFSYRNSFLQQASGWLVLRATFDLHRDAPDIIKARIADAVRARRMSQPLELPSAGSVFRRPPQGEVWRMVDRCGLRGYTIGGAAVSEKHAGFIVNRGGATAMDVCRLVGLIHARVQQVCGVSLVPEIEFLHLSEEEKCLLPIP